jgi:hypothetical protein
VSHVHRLLLSDRIFFVSVNLRRALARLSELEYGLLVEAIRESREKLHFLFLGYVLMPDHWHALIWPVYPLTISRVVQDVKWISAPLPKSQTPHRWAGLATPILGSLRPPRPGVSRTAGLYAFEPGAEGIRQSAARLAVVELQ